MKVVVPSAPVGVVEKKLAPSRLQSSLTAPFDSGFVNRIAVSMLAVGAVMLLGVLSATKSPLLASSVFAGILLGAVLLKSQELFVKKVLGPRAANETNFLARVPLGILLPLKYLFIGALLGIFVQSNWLQPVALACGFIAGQIVIVAKVVGRFAALKMRAKQ